MITLIKKRNSIETIPLFAKEPTKEALTKTMETPPTDEQVSEIQQIYDTYKDIHIKVKHLSHQWWREWHNGHSLLINSLKRQHKEQSKEPPSSLEQELNCIDHWKELFRDPFAGLEGVMFWDESTEKEIDPNTIPREALIEDLESIGLFQLIGQRIIEASQPNAEVKKSSGQSLRSSKKQLGTKS